MRCQPSRQLLRVSGEIEEAAGDLEDADDAFHQATQQSGADATTWSGYANFLLRHGRVEDAIGVLNEALDLHPAEPLLNFRLAMALQQGGEASEALVRRAFEYALAEPVRGFLPELEFAIYLFRIGDQVSANEHFQHLSGLILPQWTRVKIHRWLEDAHGKRVFDAQVMRLGLSSASLKIGEFDELVYASPSDLPDGLRIGDVSKVNIYFNLLGPRAIGVDFAPARQTELISDTDDDDAEPVASFAPEFA
jgi:tetratricopeptide (TPR) repeat protein